MSDRSTWVDPLGESAAGASADRAVHRPRYAAARESIAGPRDLGWLLIRYRMDQGLTQQQLADRLGTSYSQVSRIESGRHTPNLDTLMRMGDVLGRRLVLHFEHVGSNGAGGRVFDVEAPDEAAPVGLGRGLQALREQRRMTREQLARDCGLRVTAIERIEMGQKDPTIGMLATLLGRLGGTASIDSQGQVAIAPADAASSRGSDAWPLPINDEARVALEAVLEGS